jgi:hypothetical protein
MMPRPLIGVSASLHDFGDYGGPVLAAQWELQEEWRVDPPFLRVFEWLVEASRGGPADPPVLA